METMKKRYEKTFGRCQRAMMQVENHLEKALEEHPEEFTDILYEKAHDSLKMLLLASFGDDGYLEVAEDVLDFFERID
jgi:inosine/xanthosine triphosphate pyrophosphatase family protein